MSLTYFKKSLKAAIVVMVLGLFFSISGYGQWMEPHRLKVGASAGFGGLHMWGKPSLDFNVYRLTARISPGLKYMSGGLTYQLAFFNPKVRHDRILILSAYYHDNWLLSNRNSFEFKKDQKIYMLMPGIHVNLDHRGTVYLEVSAGGMYMHERLFTDNKTITSISDEFGVMGEIRIGGIFLSRKEHVQQFPWNPKKPPAHRIKKRKLKFK